MSFSSSLSLRVSKLLGGSAAGSMSEHLDPTSQDTPLFGEDIRGAQNADFLALGLGATSMMAMLWTVAMGRRAVGVEMRGDPALGIHWNIREDVYHHFLLIDQLMMERYGEDGIPKRADGRIYKIAETFYLPENEPGGFFTDEILTGFLSSLGTEARTCGLIYHTEFIDDRYKDGKPERLITILKPPQPPVEMDPTKIGRSIADVLDGPSTFQIAGSEVLVMLRRYLEGIEEMDLERGLEPRVRLFTSHRVVSSEGEEGLIDWFTQEEGFVDESDGRKRVLIENVRELDYRGKFRRIRVPGTRVLDLGVPEVFMIAQGFYSSDAERLGFQQEDIKVDHHDGRGPVVAQADYLAGLIEVNVDGRLRRRIASVFDKEGHEYWVRQLAVGHEDDPEVGWILVQVPDFKTFCPILAGLVPPGSDKDSTEYQDSYQFLLRDYYLEQVSLVTEIPQDVLEELQMPYGPKLFSLVERMGADALIAKNGVVAGDSFGNGHFLTSGGAMTGMVGHAVRVLEYWRERQLGHAPEKAIRSLADKIRRDTEDWMHVSAQEFSQSVPINFGDERINEITKHSGRARSERATTIDATRRHRHSLVPLNPSDWRRLVVRSGKLFTFELPPLSDVHPELRMRMDPMKSGMAMTAHGMPIAAVNGNGMNGDSMHDGMNGDSMHDGMNGNGMNGAMSMGDHAMGDMGHAARMNGTAAHATHTASADRIPPSCSISQVVPVERVKAVMPVHNLKSTMPADTTTIGTLTDSSTTLAMDRMRLTMDSMKLAMDSMKLAMDSMKLSMNAMKLAGTTDTDGGDDR
jgi:hypothetical protein